MKRRSAVKRNRFDLRTRRAAIERASQRLSETLERSRTFASLSAGRQIRFLEHGERLIEAVAGPYDLRPPELKSRDFPDFVADLIGGVFEAVVDASIRQMEAYGDLLKDATSAVDAHRRSPRRQQLLATMVLMGIGRVAMLDDGIAVRPCDD